MLTHTVLTIHMAMEMPPTYPPLVIVRWRVLRYKQQNEEQKYTSGVHDELLLLVSLFLFPLWGKGCQYLTSEPL